LRKTAELPGRVADSVHPTEKPKISPEVLHTAIQQFADTFAVEITVATRDFAKLAGTPEARIQALEWRLDYSSLLWRLASGPQPYAALFDAVVAVTFLRDTHEKRWLVQWGEADRPVLEVLKNLESGAWSLAEQGLTKDQATKVRNVLLSWLESNPATLDLDMTKLPDASVLFARTETDEGEGEGGGGLLHELGGLMTVDPLSGLEPAVREVERSRQLAERLFYYVKRMPELLGVRVELLVLKTLREPEVLGTLASLDTASRAVESLAATAATLPDRVATEREAALAQISSELTAQRAGLVQDLETSHEPLTELLEQARGTVESSRAMSEALTETLLALDAFVGRFDKGDEAATAESAQAEPAQDEAKGRPFDITDYGATAEQIGVAAQRLGETVATLDRSLPELQRMLDEAAERGARTVDHAFVRGLELLGVALAGAAIAVLVVRRVSLRWKSADRA
jgi:hypothetical protein